MKPWHQVLIGRLRLFVNEGLWFHQEAQQINDIQFLHLKEIQLNSLNFRREFLICQLLHQIDQEPLKVRGILFRVDLGFLCYHKQVRFDHRDGLVDDLDHFIDQNLGHIQ